MAADNRREADYIRQFAFDNETKGFDSEQLRVRQEALKRMTPIDRPFPTAYVAAGAGLLLLLVGGAVYFKRRRPALGVVEDEYYQAELAWEHKQDQQERLAAFRGYRKRSGKPSRRRVKPSLRVGCSLGDSPETEAAFTEALEEEHDLTPDIRRALHLARQDRHIAAAFWQAADTADRRGQKALAASFRGAGDRWGDGVGGGSRYDRPGGGR